MCAFNETSTFARHFSFRKKRWPDDYISQSLFLPTSPPYFFSSPHPTCHASASHPTSPAHHKLSMVLTGRVLAELRTQFADQSNCLDAKLDIDRAVLVELQDFYRRRAIVEQNYSDALAKLTNSLHHKHLNEIGRWVLRLIFISICTFICQNRSWQLNSSWNFRAECRNG